MRVLALDTTTRAGSVALVEDDAVTVERTGDASRTHAERLPRELLAVLEERGIGTADVDLFAVAAGPGSFTGLRIGIATIQGLALVHRRRVAAVSALDAMVHAAGADRDAGTIGVWMDAQRGDVFSALYRIAARPVFDRDRAIELDPPSVGHPSDVLSRWQALLPATALLFAGDGAVLHAAAIRSRFPVVDVLAPPALAGAIGRLAIVQERAGHTVEPGGVRPLYIRRPDAELERERHAVSKPS